MLNEDNSVEVIDRTENWLDEGELLNCSVVNEGSKQLGLIALGLNGHISVAL